MLRNIFIAILALVCIKQTNAQSLDSVLMELEYQYYVEQSDSIKSDIVLRKIDACLRQNAVSENLLIELSRVEIDYLSEEAKLDYLWNASLIYYLLDKPRRTIHYVRLYEKQDSTVNMPEMDLLKYLAYIESDLVKSDTLLNRMSRQDSTFSCLTCLRDVSTFELKHKNLRLVASYFIPGIGTAFTGKPLKGALSLTLSTLSVFAMIYTGQNQLWINTVGWSLNLFGKFYMGNVRLADRTIINREQYKKEKLAGECELQIREILNRYPLTFRTIQ